MKKFTRLFAFLLILSFAIGVVSCAAATAPGGSYGDGYMGGGFKNDAEAPSDPSDSETDDGVEGGAAENKPVYLPSGMITAGAWNDNDNYAMWLELFKNEQSSQDSADVIKAGKFNYFIQNGQSYWNCFNSRNRIKVSVTLGNEAVAGAEVVAYGNQNEVLYRAVTDAQGNAYLFTDAEDGTVEVSSGEGSASADFTAENRELALVLDAKAEKLNVIELMFVVDVTGSMGDELEFLRAELADVIDKIAENNVGATIKLALLFYRDSDDKQKFHYVDFSNVGERVNMELCQRELNDQRASGGGDYPEAVDEALLKAVNAQWSTGATTKLIFHVLDAPAHNGKKYETNMISAINLAAQKGIRICPIICSGADTITEYTMREAAIHTGGTFIFVTDDSGIGNSHYDPELPNVTVELLNSMLVRLINGYHTGEFKEPIYWKQDPNLNQN